MKVSLAALLGPVAEALQRYNELLEQEYRKAMSRRGREKAFRERVRQLYQDDVPVYYTSSMPYEIGSAAYWNDHGWKITDKTRPVGQQVIYALLLIAPVFDSSNLTPLSGAAAGMRRSRFRKFHAATDAEQQDWLWNEYLESQFEVAEADGRSAVAAGLGGAFSGEALPTIGERRAAIGRDIWHLYQYEQRGRMFSMWRTPQAMSAALDVRFGREVYERFGFLPPEFEKKPDAGSSEEGV